jgi:hypothetical protein
MLYGELCRNGLSTNFREASTISKAYQPAELIFGPGSSKQMTSGFSWYESVALVNAESYENNRRTSNCIRDGESRRALLC